MTTRRDLTLLSLILALCLLTGATMNHLDAEAAGPGIRGGPLEDKPWSVVAEPRKLPERVELVNLGSFVATAYCSCPKCCGQWSAYNLTASGTRPEEGRTIAADWSVLPVGTKVYIPSLGWRVVEDTGAGIAADRLDVYFADHREAVEFGVQTVEVWARARKEPPTGVQDLKAARGTDTAPLWRKKYDLSNKEIWGLGRRPSPTGGGDLREPQVPGGDLPRREQLPLGRERALRGMLPGEGAVADGP